MVLCSIVPHFELLAACAGDRRILGAPVGIAPLPGRAQVLGSVSPAAETKGVHMGMGMNEALARCPELRLLNADPVRAGELWEQAVVRIEALGARVEPGRPGEAYLEVDGLLAIHGGREQLVDRVASAIAKNLPENAVRVGVGPGVFSARLAADLEDPPRAPGLEVSRSAGCDYRLVSEEQAFLASLPIRCLLPGLERETELLTDRRRTERDPFTLVGELERFGIATLQALGSLDPCVVADRFGRLGLKARKLALGEAETLRPRTPVETLQTTLDLPDAVDGFLLENALRLLIDRFLALPRRQNRPLRSATLSATLSGGGSWQTQAGFNVPTSSAELLWLALSRRLADISGPASSMTLASGQLGNPEPDQKRLVSRPEEMRRGRIDEAIRQTRAVAGENSILQVIALDPDARLPEEKAILSPRDPETG